MNTITKVHYIILSVHFKCCEISFFPWCLCCWLHSETEEARASTERFHKLKREMWKDYAQDKTGIKVFSQQHRVPSAVMVGTVKRFCMPVVKTLQYLGLFLVHLWWPQGFCVAGIWNENLYIDCHATGLFSECDISLGIVKCTNTLPPCEFFTCNLKGIIQPIMK